MPGGDGTGPMGLGPMTGRGAGYCTSSPFPGFTNPIPGRRAWWGLNQPGPWFYGAPVGDEKGFLEQRAEFLRRQLNMLESRLEGLNETKGNE